MAVSSASPAGRCRAASRASASAAWRRGPAAAVRRSASAPQCRRAASAGQPRHVRRLRVDDDGQAEQRTAPGSPTTPRRRRGSTPARSGRLAGDVRRATSASSTCPPTGAAAAHGLPPRPRRGGPERAELEEVEQALDLGHLRSPGRRARSTSTGRRGAGPSRRRSPDPLLVLGQRRPAASGSARRGARRCRRGRRRW